MRLTQSGQIEVLNTGSSVFVGEGAGNSDDLSANQNVFVGYESGFSNTTGFRNTAIGMNSMRANSYRIPQYLSWIWKLEQHYWGLSKHL